MEHDLRVILTSWGKCDFGRRLGQLFEAEWRVNRLEKWQVMFWVSHLSEVSIDLLITEWKPCHWLIEREREREREKEASVKVTCLVIDKKPHDYAGGVRTKSLTWDQGSESSGKRSWAEDRRFPQQISFTFDWGGSCSFNSWSSKEHSIRSDFLEVYSRPRRRTKKRGVWSVRYDLWQSLSTVSHPSLRPLTDVRSSADKSSPNDDLTRNSRSKYSDCLDCSDDLSSASNSLLIEYIRKRSDFQDAWGESTGDAWLDCSYLTLVLFLSPHLAERWRKMSFEHQSGLRRFFREKTFLLRLLCLQIE